MDINIEGLQSKTDKTGLCMLNLTLAIKNNSDLQKIHTRFKQVSGVIDVFRTSTER